MDNFGFHHTRMTANPTTSNTFCEICAKKEKCAGTNGIAQNTSCCTAAQDTIIEQSIVGIKSFYKRFRSCLSAIEIEFMTFIIIFSISLTKVSSTSLILDKSCGVHFGYSIEICGNLQNFSAIKSSVEKVAENYQLARTLIVNVPAYLVTILFMPWSDIYSRKLPLQLAIAGAAIDAFAGALCSYNPYWRLEYYFIGTMFMGFTGGLVLIMAMLYCFISDLSTVDKRLTRFVSYELSAGLGLTVSVVSGGWIYELVGCSTVFSVSATSMVFALLWLTFIVPESRGMRNTDTWQTKTKSLFSFKMLVVMFKRVAKKLPNSGRPFVVVVLISLCVLQTSLYADYDIVYLYVHHHFDWNNLYYSNFLSLYLGLSNIVMLLIRLLLLRFDLRDGLIALLGCASAMAKYFAMGLSWNTGTFHFANALGIFILLGNCGFLSHVSKIVPNDDIGKVFSLVSIPESLSVMIGSIILTHTFNLFLHIYAGFPFLLLCAALLLPVSVAAWI